VTDLPDQWVVFNPQNSDLPGQRVLAVARDSGDGLWFGTEAGLAHFADSTWQVYRASDLGLEGDMVYALAVDSQGQVWVGTDSGAAVFNGQAWTPFTRANSGLTDNWILSIEIEPAPLGEGGDRIWFGTRSGVSRLDTASGEWTDFGQAFDPEWGGVRDLLLDSSGRLWAGTVGGGLGLWDGRQWQFYQTGNSDIPFNTVNVIAEVEPGVLWLGIAPPAQVGGVLAEFDGTQWKAYTPQDSGYSGSEALAIAQDAQGRWWIGTRTAGVDIFQPRQ
jgi:ligand-binding sensor domain-containing protein